MIKGILFDKDGTLIEFEKTWHAVMGRVFNKMATTGLADTDTLRRIKAYSGYLPQGFETESNVQHLPTRVLVRAWAELVYPESDAACEACAGQLMRWVDEASLDASTPVAIRPGVLETLHYLYDRGYKLGVATADTQRSMMHSLCKADVVRFFDYFGSDDGLTRGKPAVDMAERFRQCCGLEEGELLIVGDSVSDLAFAQKAKAHFAGVLNSYSGLTKALVEATEDAVGIDHMGELIKVFEL